MKKILMLALIFVFASSAGFAQDLAARIRKLLIELNKLRKQESPFYYYSGGRRDCFVSLPELEKLMEKGVLTAEEEEALPARKRIEKEFTLQGIICGVGIEESAIINDQIFKKGDIIKEARLIEITKGTVKLKRGKEVIVLKFKP